MIGRKFKLCGTNILFWSTKKVIWQIFVSLYSKFSEFSYTGFRRKKCLSKKVFNFWGKTI